jgi:hypothetical protein
MTLNYGAIKQLINRKIQIMADNLNFGFENEDVVVSSIIPFAQFYNPTRSDNWGIGIKEEQVEVAQFKPDSNWQLVDHKYGDKSTGKVWLTQKPRLLLLNRYNVLFMQCKGGKVEIYNKAKYSENETYKVWSYCSVMFLDKDNKFLSDVPLRLKLGGIAGISFIEQWGGSSKNKQSHLFNHLFAQYKKMSGKSLEPVSFRSHMIYEPLLEVREVGSKSTSEVCFTKGFKEYSIQEGLIKRNQEIVDLVQLTKNWGTKETILREETEEIDELASKTDADGVVHDPELEARLEDLF